MGRFAELISARLAWTARRWPFDCADQNVVLISGSGRSGTSWLANICNFNNDFRYLFEPLNPSQDWLTESPVWHPEARHLSPSVDQVIRGKVSGTWINRQNRKLFAKRRLIKEIRTNMMLANIEQQYPNIKTVLIMRSPISVAHSRTALDKLQDDSQWVWNPTLQELLAQPQTKLRLDSERYQMLSHQIGSGVFMESIADWCLNNLFMLEAYPGLKAHIVFYEDLLRQPELVVRELFTYLDIEYNDQVLGEIERRSETSRNLRPGGEKSNLDLDGYQIKKASTLLKAFNIERFYDQQWQPKKQILEKGAC